MSEYETLLVLRELHEAMRALVAINLVVFVIAVTISIVLWIKR